MNKEKACIILDINPNLLNESVLRKKYKIACLKTHPDKNVDLDSSLFIEIKDAYDFLIEVIKKSKYEYDVNSNSLFNNIDNDKLYYYVSLLQLFKEKILEKSIIQPIIDHIQKYNYYEINPTIEQLFNKCVYLFEGTYIPLWHHEIVIGNNIIKIIPNIPDYMHIDNNNNIHIYVSLTDIPKTFEIGGASFLLDDYKDQTKYFKGIPVINEKNIFDVSILSNLVFHIKASPSS